ncbi:GGDEF domain-containing protein [Ammoniphilus sp. YIM 78166]|uniref:GGDEF domain-containing protein n=1 Tax=Ammoniphilus sp. YIM 78166 TaxID=1644106 RepID=UPI00106F980C|nr:GGDEF domain-containing protein [Ammoniphilus sp. YIM 78166]
MVNRLLVYLFVFVTLFLSITLNFLYPFLGLWMLFLMPMFGIIVLFPKWLVGNLCIVFLVIIRYGTHYAAFSGNIPIDYLYRLVSTSTVGWLILLTVTFFIIKNRRLVEELEHLSLTDNLTQAYNRRFVELHSKKLFSESIRKNQPLCFLLVDIDHFKKINDLYGHNVGDLVLQQLATNIRDTIRKTDVFIRMGGEEFALFLPNTSLQEGVLLAERIRRTIQGVKIEYRDSIIPITISLGVTEYNSETLEDLIEKADQALYQAKSNGRNTVVNL